LILEIPVVNKFGFLDKAVRQCGFAVVNMGDNTKIADKFDFCH
jgi:hypothetical protein